jgi:hypothetical protein
MKINIPGKVEQQPSETAQQEPRNDVEETEAEIEIAPSANIEATVERIVYAIGDDDDLIEHES